MGIAKITRNYQVTLSKDVREIVGLREGDEVMLTVEDGKVVIVKSAHNPIMAAAGVWKGVKETGAEYQKRIRKQWKKRQEKLNW